MGHHPGQSASHTNDLASRTAHPTNRHVSVRNWCQNKGSHRAESRHTRTHLWTASRSKRPELSDVWRILCLRWLWSWVVPDNTEHRQRGPAQQRGPVLCAVAATKTRGATRPEMSVVRYEDQ